MEGAKVFLWLAGSILVLAMLLTTPLRLYLEWYEDRFRQRLRTADEEVGAALADGTVRLVSMAWIQRTEMETLQRRQELPDEAFLAPADARALYASNTRAVAVLSYRWLRPEHPDPCGQRLAAIKALLACTVLPVSAIFWDYASLPQKGWDRATRQFIQRTQEEANAFSRGIGIMGNLYASLESTTVLQLKKVPAPPAGYAGEEYNMTPYDGSGWCNFEQGAATLVVGHVTLFKRLAQRVALANTAMVWRCEEIPAQHLP